ncbi:MAG TPA: hypothetical protein VI279_00185, partial [Rhodocyclaceae bacterium]
TTGVVQTGTNEVTKNITTSTNDNKTTSTPVEDIKWDSVLPSTSTTTAYIPVGHTLGGGNGEFGENDPSQSNKDKNKDKDKDSNTNNPNDNKPNDNKPSGSLPKC